jgi:mono/diheme cytochrome c family protein
MRKENESVRRLRALVAAAIVIASAAPAAAQTAPLTARGQALLQSKCAYCHAIGPSGDSPHRGAPPFRMLMQRYPPQALEEALGEGLSTGHPDMPEFVFEPAEIAAIVAYLNVLRSWR